MLKYSFFPRFIRKYLFLLCLFLITGLGAQELPPIQVYMPDMYGAEDQNWSVSQGLDRTMYFANNDGLLSFDGARWTLNPSPNESIMRSVKVIEDKIYTGCYMNFGYWMKDDFGALNYTSLSDKIELADDEEFWNIIEIDRWVLFQSLDRIYIYDTKDKSFSVISSETTLTKAYKVNSTIYYQKLDDGIYKLENGTEKLVTNANFLKSKNIINIFDDAGKLLMQTKENGFYVLDENSNISEWDKALNLSLQNYSLYNSVQLKNGMFILGTVSNGILAVNKNKDLVYEVDQGSGLGNNTILSLFEDVDNNVWLAMDNGISNINFNSPFRVYRDNLGKLGTVYATYLDGNKLYIGTNQGLFFKIIDSDESFQFIKGTEGQVWSIKKLHDKLFCGHDKGTFIITDNIAKRINGTVGTWQVQEIPNKPNFLIQGIYNGLSILEFNNNKWVLRNKLKGFNTSSQYFEPVNSTNYFVSHEHKGIYKLTIDSDFRKITSVRKEDLGNSIKSSLVLYNNKILFGSSDGVFHYNQNSNSFEKDTVLTKLYQPENYISGKLIAANGKLFAFSKEKISYLQKGNLSSDYELFSLALPKGIRETKNGYENVIHINDDKYLIGNTSGYIIADLEHKKNKVYEINLDEVSVSRLDAKQESLQLTKNTILPNDVNNVKFWFSVKNYNKYLPTLYQYRLLGLQESWSSWSSDSEAFFENLPYGTYTLQVRAKVANQDTSNSINFDFNIERPWYLKSFAIGMYIISVFIIIIVVHLVYRSYYKAQRKKLLKEKEKELEIKQLENEQQLMYYKNQDLQKDIESKNRELGLSTMNLVKRNELLSNIKKELTTTKNEEDVVRVIKMIDKNINTSDDWELFEQAFENADKDFLKKLKKRHSNLTSNDLRLCTYLRLNLSSKEIAPLLNISIRSVEVKRYRLRKKMNLPHEASLSNYILQL